MKRVMPGTPTITQFPRSHAREFRTAGQCAGCGGGRALLGGMTLLTCEHESFDPLHETAKAFWSLTLTSAPALLLGFTLAGVVGPSRCEPHRAVHGRSRPGHALRGVLFGLPLPVCSCGVVPMYQSLIQRGAPVTAGLAFLIATPELGLDALLLSVPLLGWSLTLARVVAAFLVAILVAVVVGGSRDVQRPPPPSLDPGPAPALRALSRASAAGSWIPSTTRCPGWCSDCSSRPSSSCPWTTPCSPGCPGPAGPAGCGRGAADLRVCLRGDPLAAVAVHKGLSGLPALTFLLAGPATNVTTFGILAALHGRKLAIRYGVSLTILAALAGWGVDLLGIQVPDAGHPGEAHARGGAAYEVVAFVGLLIVAAASVWRQGARGAVEQVLHPMHHH